MQTIYQQFCQSVRRHPHKDAIILVDEKISFFDLDKLIRKKVTEFKNLGVTAGDVVGLLLPNSIEFAIVLMVAAKLRLTLVPLCISLPINSIAKSLKLTGAKYLVCSPAFSQELRGAFDGREFDAGYETIESLLEANGRRIIETNNWLLLEYIDKPDKKLANADKSYIEERNSEEIATTQFDESTFIITMTSGSTGDPKPIVLTQQTKKLRYRAAIELYSIVETDRILISTPLYHSLAERLLLLSLTQANTCVILPNYSAEQWVKAVENHKVTFTIAVSSQLKQVLPLLNNRGSNIENLRCVVSSSELLDTKSKMQLIHQLNCDFHECYGTSEVSIVSNLSPSDNAINSVGKPANGVEVCIIDDAGNCLPSGEVGEIVSRSELHFLAYLGMDAKTKECDWKGFFKTGDLGYLDEDGYLYFNGRKKDIVITGGINVYPKDVEGALINHPKVEEVTVVALPDERLGEIVTAVIVSSDRLPIKLKELRRCCFKGLADYQYPQKYFFVDSIAKNRMGKVMKSKVVEQIRC